MVSQLYYIFAQFDVEVALMSSLPLVFFLVYKQRFRTSDLAISYHSMLTVMLHILTLRDRDVVLVAGLQQAQQPLHLGPLQVTPTKLQGANCGMYLHTQVFSKQTIFKIEPKLDNNIGFNTSTTTNTGRNF